jgi:anti-sigma28 factor (negative regulator of flagellin synthesis)
MTKNITESNNTFFQHIELPVDSKTSNKQGKIASDDVDKINKIKALISVGDYHVDIDKLGKVLIKNL